MSKMVQLELSEIELQELLNKCDLLELDALYFITKSAEDIDRRKLVKVANDLMGEKGIRRFNGYLVPIDQVNAGALSLIENISKFNDRELNFLAPLIDNSTFYLCNYYDSSNIEEEILLDDFKNLKNVLYQEIEYKNKNILKKVNIK